MPSNQPRTIRLAEGIVCCRRDGSDWCGNVHGDIREAMLCSALLFLPLQSDADLNNAANRGFYRGGTVDLGAGPQLAFDASPESKAYCLRWEKLYEDRMEQHGGLASAFPELNADEALIAWLRAHMQMDPPTPVIRRELSLPGVSAAPSRFSEKRVRKSRTHVVRPAAA